MKLTPMLQQYFDLKKLHPECLLFFRVGDFYETYFEDAELLHQKLDFALTDKSKNKDGSIKMAGIPHFSLEKYLPRLLSFGFKIAVAEQMNDPIPGKLVQREITQIITPGTYIQEGEKQFNYLFALTHQETKEGLHFHVAWGDFTIGEYWTKSFATLAEVQKWVLTLKATELIIDVDFPDKETVSRPLQQYVNGLISIYEIPSDPELFLRSLCNIQTLASFGQATQPGRLQAITLLLNYLKHTQINSLKNINKISYHAQTSRVLMDEITIKNLEIFASSYEQNEKYSLCGVLDTTVTHAGSRLLKHRLLNPINDLALLKARATHIARYQEHPSTMQLLQALRGTSDISKLVSSILYKKLIPTPFIKLRTTLKVLFDPQEPLFDLFQTELTNLGLLEEEHQQLTTLLKRLEQALQGDEQISFPTDYVADGYDAEIDELRKVAYHSDEALLDYQQMLVKASGVPHVKLKFVMNQGYFIELTSKDAATFVHQTQLALQNAEEADKAKLQVLHRQTLKGNLRYISPYLEELQANILSAKDQLAQQEYRILEDLREQISAASAALFALATTIAQLDLSASHAIFARDHRYVQPLLTQEASLQIKAGRHPVIETFLPPDQPFIPNDLLLGKETKKSEIDAGLIHIIT